MPEIATFGRLRREDFRARRHHEPSPGFAGPVSAAAERFGGRGIGQWRHTALLARSDVRPQANGGALAAAAKARAGIVPVGCGPAFVRQVSLDHSPKAEITDRRPRLGGDGGRKHICATPRHHDRDGR